MTEYLSKKSGKSLNTSEVALEIRHYLNIIWRRKFTILLALITTMTCVAIGTKKIIPVYGTSATLRVATSAGGSVNYSDYMYADRLMNTYTQIATSRPVLDELMAELSLTEPPEIKAEIIPNTELIKITAEDTDPAMAAKIANTLANVLVTQNSKLFIGGGRSTTNVLEEQLNLVQQDLQKAQQTYENLLIQTPIPESLDTTKQLLQLKQSNYASLLSQYEQARFREEIQASMITIFETAVIPETPTRPNVLLNMVLAFVVGLAGGLGLALVFENLDTTLYEVRDIETTTELPVMIKIPKASRRDIVTFQGESSSLTEAFRNLATNIQVINHQQAKQVLLLISAEPNQGKSMITFHLACSLAELENHIVVIDCDTRIPRLHSFFHLPNRIGLKDVLEQTKSLEEALQKTAFEGVHVLTSGSQLAHPSQLLGSAQMTQLVKKLKEQFDYVLLDSPAMLAVADTSALVPIADELILTVRCGRAQKAAVQTTSAFLAGQKEKLTFLIVNEVDSASHYYYYNDRKRLRSLSSLLNRF